MVAAKTFPSLKVVIVEANPLNFLLAHHNVWSNNLQDRVVVKCRAVKSDSRPLDMTYDYENPGSSMGAGVDADKQCERPFVERLQQSRHINQFCVPSLPLEEILQAYVPPLDQFILKIDCEGCEYSAFDYLRVHGDRILVSLTPTFLLCFIFACFDPGFQTSGGVPGEDLDTENSNLNPKMTEERLQRRKKRKT